MSQAEAGMGSGVRVGVDTSMPDGVLAVMANVLNLLDHLIRLVIVDVPWFCVACRT